MQLLNCLVQRGLAGRSKVVIDDYASAFKAVSYLVEKGFCRIAHFAGPLDLGICKARLKGYHDALAKAKLPPADNLVQCGGMHEQDGYQSMDRLLKDNRIPDAIFAVNDPVAIGAFQRIKEAGLRIPQDIAIMGFSNNKITSLVDPQMTTIDQPSLEMGRKAAEILLGNIRNGTAEPTTVVLDTKLIVRGST